MWFPDVECHAWLLQFSAKSIKKPMWSKVYDTSIASCWEKPIFVLFILLINVVLPWLESTPFVPNYRLFDFFNPKFDHSSYSKICAKHHFFCCGLLYRQYIRCKPTSSCKLCKLQSGHRINIQGRGAGEVQQFCTGSTSLGCWSGGPDLSLHSLYGEIGLHLICPLLYQYKFFKIDLNLIIFAQFF